MSYEVASGHFAALEHGFSFLSSNLLVSGKSHLHAVQGFVTFSHQLITLQRGETGHAVSLVIPG